MHQLTPKDASVLAIVVENPKMSERQYQRLLTHVTDPELRELIGAIRDKDLEKPLTDRTWQFIPVIQDIEAWRTANEGRRGPNNRTQEDAMYGLVGALILLGVGWGGFKLLTWSLDRRIRRVKKRV